MLACIKLKVHSNLIRVIVYFLHEIMGSISFLLQKMNWNLIDIPSEESKALSSVETSSIFSGTAADEDQELTERSEEAEERN